MIVQLLTGTFTNKQGVAHVISIYDMEGTSHIIPVPTATLNSPGYSLNWNAGVSDISKGGLIPSECSFSIQNTDGILDDLLSGLQVNEYRYTIKVHRATELYWTGVLLQDFGMDLDLPEGTISFTAVDGL